MKKNIRKNLLLKRDHINPVKKKEKEAAIRKRLYALGDFKRANSILFYASFRSEVDTIACIKHALKLKKKVALPRVEKKVLGLYYVKDLKDLSQGFMGIPEPDASRCKKIGLKDINLVIVPGAGFDVKGNRLGYGAGYYDRLLYKSKKSIVIIALAFEEQIRGEIPAEPHDIKIDMIITDKRLIKCT